MKPHRNNLFPKKSLYLFLAIFNFNIANAATTNIDAGILTPLSITEDIVNFTGADATLIIDINKTLSSISASGNSSATNGVGIVNFNNEGATLTINNSIGSSSKIIQNIIFNEDATLAIKDDIYAENIINNASNNIGTLIFNGSGTVQNISAKIGNADYRIQNINVSNIGATGTKFGADVFVQNITTSGVINIAANTTIDVSGNLSGSGIGKIKGNSNAVGNLNLSGTEKQTVDVAIGVSPTIKLGVVTVNNSSADGAIFTQNIFTSRFNVNGLTTLAGSGTNDLGLVSISPDKELIFLSSNSTMNSLENSGTINIPSGKTINISKDTSLSGTIKIGVDYDSSGAVISGMIKAFGDVNIADGLKINFDFAEINRPADENLYPFLIVDPSKKLTIADIDKIKVEDNSILMNVSLRLSADHKKLLVFHGVNQSTLSLLDPEYAQIAQNILNINGGGNSKIKLVQNQLIKISDLETLENSLKTLKAPTNNMIPSTANDLMGRANNVIISHLTFGANKKNIWTGGFDGKASQKLKINHDGYNSDMIGIVLGSDFTIKNPHIDNIIGAAFTYSKANIDSMSANKASINSFGLAFYNRNIENGEADGSWYNDNIINLAYNKYQQNRAIKVGNFGANANANFYGTHYGARTGIGYNFKLSDDLIISPSIAIKYSRQGQSSYTESGADDVGLKIKNHPFNNFSSEIGTKIIYNNKLDNQYTMMPALNLGWIKNLKTNGQELTSSFIAGGNEINNHGSSLVHNIFILGFEISLINNKEDLILTFKHDIQGASGFKSQTSYIKYRQFF